MDWFLKLARHHIDYSEINFINPPDYTIRFARITDEPSVGQSNWRQDDFFMAWIPELDGCMTQAKDQPEVMVMIRDAMKEYLASLAEDGIEPPAPRCHLTVTRS